MFKCDYHTHTCFSFDGDPAASPDTLCEAAISRGVTDLAITDHFECNWRSESIYPPYLANEAYEAIMSAKKKYKEKLNLTYGIELGQATQYPEEAQKILDSYDFEFILGSLHNLSGAPDFYYFDFSKINSDEYLSNLFERYVAELGDIVESFPRIDTVTHITYMQRYIKLSGKDHDFSIHFNSLERLFKKMIARDIALELNVSTLWNGLGFTMPTKNILSLYRDCGGRFVTVGTDSHSIEHIGERVEEGFSLLRSVGLNEIIVFRNGEKTVVKI